MSTRKLPLIHQQRVEPAGSRIRFEMLDLEFSNGAKRTYSRMQTHGLGSVIVVPMLDEDTVLLAREYACGLHHYELGLPKGRLEKGETTLAGANREMKEEIGYGARKLVVLKELSLAPAYMTHITHVVLAQDLYAEKLEGDEPEALDVVPWPISDLDELVTRNDCTEGRSIAALYIARDYIRNRTGHA